MIVKPAVLSMDGGKVARTVRAMRAASSSKNFRILLTQQRCRAPFVVTACQGEGAMAASVMSHFACLILCELEGHKILLNGNLFGL